MEPEDILMRNQELTLAVARLTAERDSLMRTVEALSNRIHRLRAERDEVRKEICNRTSYPDRTPEIEARMRGWDCYGEAG